MMICRAQIAFLALLIGLLVSMPTYAADTPPQGDVTPRQTLALDYDIYWKGVKVMNGLMTFTQTPDNTIASAMRFETKGILDWFTDGEIVVVGESQLNGGDAQPLRYQTFSKWDKKVYARHLIYSDDGTLPTAWFQMPSEMMEREAVPQDAQMTLDPVSLIVMALYDPWDLTANPEREVILESFDGLRAFRHTTYCAAVPTTFKTRRKVPYEGDVIVCNMTGKQTYGFRTVDDDEKDEKRRAKSAKERADAEEREQNIELYLVWSAEFEMYVPVRIEARSDGGTIRAYLKDTNTEVAMR